MKKILFFLITFLSVVQALNAQQFSKQDFKKLSWILGKWRMQIKNGWLCEQWHVMNDSTLQSKGYIVKSTGDTLLLEAVQIALRDHQLFYISTVNGQNDNKAVPFTFSKTSGESFTAVNAAHDFPQVIYYRSAGKDAMYAAVSGKEKGVEKKEEFNYKRF